MAGSGVGAPARPVARIGCAAVCRALGEPQYGSAPSTAGTWLLIEHPGPWPAFGLPRDIPADVADLVGDAIALRIRPQLIRRPSDRRPVPPHRVYVGSAAGTDVWMERRELTDLRGLRELDLRALAAGRPAGFGEPVTEPLLLVCTHGRRDACCAQFGRPTAVALAERFGDPIWETTHVGGDRFAANLVCLPYGTYHGQVFAADAVRVGGAALRGEVDLGHYRGRAGMPAAVQAADYFARRFTGERRVLAIRALRRRAGADGAVAVDLDVAGRRLRVVVRAAPAGCPRLTSCSEGAIGDPVEYTLDRIEEPAAQRGGEPVLSAAALDARLSRQAR
jgi:hypothetical protein